MKLVDADPAALAPAQVAQVELEFARAPGGATYLQRQRAAYPFHVGRCLHRPGDPAGMPCVLLQSCSGGLFEGDDLRLRIAAGAGAAAHVGTAACTVAHDMPLAASRQRLELVAAPGALLEYLPEALILFPGAKVDSRVRVSLAPGATVIVGDAFLRHDFRGGDARFDWLRAEIAVEDPAGRLLACDRLRIDGCAFGRGTPGIDGSWNAQATLFVLGSDRGPAELVDALRRGLSGPDAYGGAGVLPNRCGAWARVLARDAAALKGAIFAARSAVRRLVTGTMPVPRVR